MPGCTSGKEPSFGLLGSTKSMWCGGCARKHDDGQSQPESVPKSGPLKNKPRSRRIGSGVSEETRAARKQASRKQASLRSEQARKHTRLCKEPGCGFGRKGGMAATASFGMPDSAGRGRLWCARCAARHPGSINNNINRVKAAWTKKPPGRDIRGAFCSGSGKRAAPVFPNIPFAPPRRMAKRPAVGELKSAAAAAPGSKPPAAGVLHISSFFAK